jgi:hypothetical protein
MRLRLGGKILPPHREVDQQWNNLVLVKAHGVFSVILFEDRPQVVELVEEVPDVVACPLLPMRM